MNFVYLLRNKTGDAFKIGVSCDPQQRGAQLPQKLDWKKSLQVSMSGGNAYKVESMLHYLFREHSKNMPFGDGYTEWFGIDAWADVLAFLDAQKELLGVGALHSLSGPPKRIALDHDAIVEKKRFADISRKERQVRLKAQRDRQHKAATHHNMQVLDDVRVLLKEMNDRQIIVGVYFDVHTSRGKLVLAALDINPNQDLSTRFSFLIRKNLSLFIAGYDKNTSAWVQGGVSLFGGYSYECPEPFLFVDIPILGFDDFTNELRCSEKVPGGDLVVECFSAYFLKPESNEYPLVSVAYEHHLENIKSRLA